CSVEKAQEELQRGLFDTNFNYSDVTAIEIVEIAHPMLGGVISTQILTSAEQRLFIERLKRLKEDGLYKCMDKYVIRVMLSSDTLRLKVCGEKISNRFYDLYY